MIIRPAAAAAIALAIGLTHAARAAWPPAVESALAQAGENRAELERVLEHFADAGDDAGDEQKLHAAEFLIANMPGHGYVVNGFFDADGNEVAFDALEHGSYGQARGAFEALEREHGSINYARVSFAEDLHTVTAAQLIEEIDLAFAAWRANPWAASISFDAFCEYILPYRGSNEPVEPWRAACAERLAHVTGGLEDPRDLAAAARAVQRAAEGWVRFSELYYLHPTDQGYAEMTSTRTGRCEDISNMVGYALRAAAIPAAQDYTPYWANRDNNHAWSVLLDAEGRGRAGLSYRAAKIYRKTYSARPDSLGARRRDGEHVPRWLASRHFRDVTDQYMETTDVTVELTAQPPDGSRFAYLCVFNGGEWRPIHWSENESGRANFDRMGRGVVYLPAYATADGIVAAAPPLIVEPDGAVRALDGAGGATIDVSIAETGSEADALLMVKPGAEHELLVWDGGWRSLGQPAAPAVIEHVPAGRLYWFPTDGDRSTARIFTVEDGRRVGW